MFIVINSTGSLLLPPVQGMNLEAAHEASVRLGGLVACVPM
jgi:hypothetical protein